MECSFEKRELSALLPRIHEHFAALTDATDGFFDDNIAEAQHYAIELDGKDAGYFAAKEDRLTAFWLRDECLRDAKSVFDAAIERYGLKRAYAASCDRNMVNLCVERAVLGKKEIALQAHFFRLGEGAVRPAEFGPEQMRLVEPEHYRWLNERMENEWRETLDSRLDARVYALEADGEALGFGLLCPHRLRQGVMDIGNYVMEKHRRRGVGRSVILNLTHKTLAEGKIPSVGCWYYNHNSYLTLTSAGYLPVTRLLNVEL